MKLDYLSSSSRNSNWLALPLSLLLVALGVSACARQTPVTKVADPSGTYTLGTVNGQALPCTPPHEGGAPQVTAGSITLNADGTFTSAMSYAGRDGRTGSRDFSGTWTREGDRFLLKWKGAGMTSANLEGDTFTMNNEGILFAYKK